ncbi:uncharacterized protein LOC114745120 isoform X2 [Neltuma alba]|uniref:uncharacterized protein LOC114745120 isoform X2 n=1 Tax=Neltuma alba TaxID=207710 RepID=UPI0010A53DBE|nr:uncharacterized protein LOC114745120 isoform X2 [Prosopis alba]
MGGKWSEAFERCKQERALWTAKITGTGDTVLHMAVSSGEEKVVANMVEFLVEQEKSFPQNDVVVTMDEDDGETWNMNTVLSAENDRKNTPLHLAAIEGSVEMSRKIGGTDRSLIARRNIAGETPLFLAALNGRKKAFLWLHYLYVGSHGVSSTGFAHCIRDNEDTILHCAIAEGHAGVAIEIVHLYKDHLKEMMKRNKKGLSPLHLLAAKRSAFKSTSLHEVPILALLIYRLWKVNEKNQATTLEELQAMKDKKNYEGKSILVKFMKRVALILLRVAEAFLQLTCSDAVIIRWRSPFSAPKMKKMHTRWHQIMTKLLHHASKEDMSQIISRTVSEHLSISLQTEEDNELESMPTPASGTITIDTPLMIATKNGVTEVVKAIFELFPSTFKDVNTEGKNIFLLAIEYRQTDVYCFLCKWKWLKESLSSQVDKEGNNALHLAVSLEFDPNRDIGEAFSMQSEQLRWLFLVMRSLPYDLYTRYNKKMETPRDILEKSRKELMKIQQEWVAKTSQACSVVSSLVVSAAFATRTNVPGAYDENGYAILRNKTQALKIFKDSSLVALFCSLISTICFLSIVASPSRVLLWSYLSFKFYIGISFMFISIVFLSISFCAADFFMLDVTLQTLHYFLRNYMPSSLMIILLVVVQVPTFLRPIFPQISHFPTYRYRATLPIEYRRTKNEENGRELRHQN